MRRRFLKNEILQILALDDMHAVRLALSDFKPQDVINPLFTALCSTNEYVRWHAVSCFGDVVLRMAERDLEGARIIMRRFLWTLNDESGGIGWGVPEAMGEILARHDQLNAEYHHMLISYMRDDGPELFQDGNYLELPLLQRGLLWGVGRLCATRRKQMTACGVAGDVMPYLHSTDIVTRGMAVRCLSILQHYLQCDEIDALSDDMTEILLYVDEQLVHLTVGQLAAQHLAGAQARV